MLYEDSYLAHYGIKGQKWGVRRFQNKDGTLTNEGRKRYLSHLDNSFESAKSRVKSGLSNRPKAIANEPIDISKVRQRGKLTKSEAERCAVIAKNMYSKMRPLEPEITSDVIDSIKKTNGSMYDLDKRMKTPTSIAAKIGSDAKDKDLSFEDSANQINDVLRYTSVSDDGNFVLNYTTVKSALEGKGYTEAVCKNYFEKYKNNESKHKAVQCVYKNADGVPFEIQFQTYASQAAKDLKTPIYEKRRQRNLSKKEKAELERQMRDLSEYVPYPRDIFKIKSH